MMIIEIWINDLLIAEAQALNVSKLAEISDYEVEAVSLESPVTGLLKQHHEFDIGEHPRVQSPWALVAKIAELIAKKENEIIERQT